MFDKLKEIWEMKAKADEIKKQLEGIKFTSEDEYSSVTVKGTFEVEEISIKCEMNEANKKNLEKSLTQNINKAVRNAQIESAKRMLTSNI